MGLRTLNPEKGGQMNADALNRERIDNGGLIIAG